MCSSDLEQKETGEALLNKEQIAQYHSDGFLSVESVIDKDLVTELQKVTDGFVECSRAVKTHTKVFEIGRASCRERV